MLKCHDGEVDDGLPIDLVCGYFCWWRVWTILEWPYCKVMHYYYCAVDLVLSFGVQYPYLDDSIILAMNSFH